MRPLEYLVTSSANLSLAAAWVSLAVALPMSIFIAGAAALACPGTVPAASKDAAKNATFEIDLFIIILSSKKIRNPGTLAAARAAQAPMNHVQVSTLPQPRPGGCARHRQRRLCRE